MTRDPATAHRVWDQLREAALRYPGAEEALPWDESVVKVNRKIFVFLGRRDGDDLGITVKLTASLGHALALPGSAPASHGLGKHGWVSVRLAGLDADLLEDWIDESYRNVAPKRLVAELTDRS